MVCAKYIFVLIFTCMSGLTSIQGDKGLCPSMYTRFDGSCYMIYPYTFSWIEAQAFCQLDGAHLVFIESKREHDFLKTMADNQSKLVTNNLWIGTIEYQGQYIRYAGTNQAAEYLDFIPGEPSRTNRDDCVTIWKNKDWKMADYGCGSGGNKFSFICEK